MSKKKPVDWRTLPRKPAEQVKSVRIAFRLTAANAERLKANAAEAGKTMVDYVIARCCR